MAFPRSFLRHTLLWDLAGGERAACGIAWDNDGGGVLSLTSEITTAFQDRATAFWTALESNYDTNTFFVGSKLALIGVNGNTVETAELATVANGGSNPVDPLPHGVAIVVSLKTGLGTRRGRGRFYLPATDQLTVGAGGRLKNANQVDIANAADAYLTPFTEGAAEFFPVVASEVGGLLTPVTELRVGNVFDSQRRRRDELVEVWETRAVS